MGRGTGGTAGYVPEGPNDRSQAIYCLESDQNGIRPVGVRCDRIDWGRPLSAGNESTGFNQTVPYGTDLLVRVSRQ
jgi:hypothetical protein